MDLGEFRQATKDLPDNTDLVVTGGDAAYHETADVTTLAPVLEHPWCVILSEGSEVTLTLDLHHRDGL